METEAIIKLYQDEFIKLASHYNKVQDKMDSFRGKKLTPENEETINDLLYEIQDTFIALRPFLLFVVKNFEMCKLSLQAYTTFIDDLKRAGAVEVKDERH